MPSAVAEDSFWADDSSPQGQIGLVWYEDVLRSGNGISSVTAYSNSGDGYVCSSLSDSKCETYPNRQVEIMLPPCSEAKRDFCIEGMQVGTNTSNVKSGSLVRSIEGGKVAPDSALGIPAGGTTSIWRVSGVNHTGGNDQYSVGARLRYSIAGGRSHISSFEASIVPFREVAGSDYRLMEMRVVDTPRGKQLVHDWHVGNCIWQEPGKCAVATRWSEGAIASISLRVPNRVTGWLHGRLEQPDISISALSSITNLITVTAKPVSVQGSAPKVKVSEITPELLKVITRNGAEPLRSDSGYVWQLEPASYNLDWFNAWLPFTKDTAQGFSDYWNFKSIAGNFPSAIEAKCLSSTSKLVGLVTTNSLWYSGNPPTFSDSELTYKVAALHFNQDGKTPFLGTYDLVIDSAAARCLYGYTSAPIQASLSVISSNGTNQVATTTLTENGGWLRLSAKGFTFSDPTIKVKFTQTGEKSTTPQSSVATKKTITCKKGKNVKKVVAAKPFCPAGYKKS